MDWPLDGGRHEEPKMPHPALPWVSWASPPPPGDTYRPWALRPPSLPSQPASPHLLPHPPQGTHTLPAPFWLPPSGSQRKPPQCPLCRCPTVLAALLLLLFLTSTAQATAADPGPHSLIPGPDARVLCPLSWGLSAPPCPSPRPRPFAQAAQEQRMKLLELMFPLTFFCAPTPATLASPSAA